MKKSISLIIVLLVIAALASCSGNPANSVSKNTVGGISFGEFDDVGNDPNNLYQNGQMAFDDNYIYFYISDQENEGIYRVDYSGNDFSKICDGGGTCINLYKNKIYYMTYMGMDIEVFDLDTMDKTEASVSSSGTGTSGIKRGGVSYGSYGHIDNFFISNDYLFYTNTSGFSGTSEGKETKAYAVKIDSGSDPICISDKGGIFSKDKSNLYILGQCKIPFSDLDNWSEDKIIKQNSVGSYYKYENGLLMGDNGICCIPGRDIKYVSYTYDSLDSKGTSGWTEPVEFFDLETVEDNDAVLSLPRFIIGNSMVCIGKSIIFYRGCDFNKKEVLCSINRVCGMGRHNGSVYVVTSDADNLNLYKVDSDGSYTNTQLDKSF